MNREEEPRMFRFGRWRRVARRTNPCTIRRNPEPEPSDPRDIFHPAPNSMSIPYYTPTPDVETDYHPNPGNPLYPNNLYDPVLIPEELPNYMFNVTPISPDSSHHSSVGDNFEYPDIQSLDIADNDGLQHVLDNHTTLVYTTHLNLQYAEISTNTLQAQYLYYLTRVKEHYFTTLTSSVQYASGDWIRSILHHFPRTPYWIQKTNNLLNKWNLEDVGGIIENIRRWVYESM